MLWLLMLGGPLAWFVGLNLDYALIHLACSRGTTLPLHLVSLVVLPAAASIGVVARSHWRRLGSEWPDEAGGKVTRTRFMLVVAILASALFSLLVLAQWVAKLFLDPCMGI